LEEAVVEEEDAVLLLEAVEEEELVAGDAAQLFLLLHVHFQLPLDLEEHLLLMANLLVFTI
jgi:hypothetical protein